MRKSTSLSHWEISNLLRQSRTSETGHATDLSQCDKLCWAFAEALDAKDDPLFDRARFLKSCDYQKDNV